MGVTAQDAVPDGGQDAIDSSLWDEASGSAQYALATSSPPASSPPSASTVASGASNSITASVAASSSARPASVAGSLLQRLPRQCSFVMLAEFDIDRGSTLAHVYPSQDSVKSHDDHTLAELMLPDGAHARSEDWTVFFLAGEQDAAQGGPESEGAPSAVRASPPLTYVLNLVRTKHDASVRRGALVKAMAIGTRHPCIHIFKPVLLLALDDYFNEPGPAALARLFDAINSIDLSALPALSRAEKLVLRASERRDLFQDRFIAPEALSPNGGTTPSERDFAASNAGHSRTASRPISPMPIPIPMPRKASAASLRPAKPIIGGAGISPLNTSVAREGLPKDTHCWETSVRYGKMDIPIKWPVDVWEEEIGEYSISALFQTFSSHNVSGPLHPHLHSNGPLTHPITLLFNAIATYKRVIFLGHNLPAATVAGHVLAATALASGCGAVIPGVKDRVSPYANLITLDVLEKTPGFIAGVTNPRFEELRCWDVLCNIETGRITVHKDIEPAPRVHLSHSSAGSISSGGIGSTNGSAGLSNQGIAPTYGPISSDHDSASLSWQSDASTLRGKSSLGGSSIGKGRSGTVGEFGNWANVIPDSRQDGADSLFMEETAAAIQARFSEGYVRARITDYVSAFVRHVTRHEEHFYGAPTTESRRLPHQPYLNGQMGSGTAFGDRDAEMRELMANAGRVEGFRATKGYKLWSEADLKQRTDQAIAEIDVWHQICRLRGRGRAMQPQEADLIFTSLSRAVKDHDQIVELLTFLPHYAGGLSPLALGLYHPHPPVRLSASEILSRLAAHQSAGIKFIQSLSLFHRLALARVESERSEALVRLNYESQERSASQDTMTGMPQGGFGHSPYPAMLRNGPLLSPTAAIKTDPFKSIPMSAGLSASSNTSYQPASRGPLGGGGSTFLSGGGPGTAGTMSRQLSSSTLPPSSTTAVGSAAAPGAASDGSAKSAGLPAVLQEMGLGSNPSAAGSDAGDAKPATTE